MNSVIETLLKVTPEEAWPLEHTSSYWLEHGKQVVIEKHNEKLILQAAGCESIQKERIHNRILRMLERLYNRPVTSQLKSYPSVWKAVSQLTHDLSSSANTNAFKSANVLSILADHWLTQGQKPKSVAIIGDGSGFLGALIRRYLPGIRLYCIDLPKMLIFQSYTHEMADRNAKMKLYPLKNKDEAADIFFVTPSDIEAIPESIDCAINTCSMQEMRESSISAYFSFLRKRSAPNSHFYCLNRERKELTGGEVASFLNYPWDKKDQIFLDGKCQFLDMFLTIRLQAEGPRLLGFRLPLVNYLDTHLHRLVHLEPHP